MTTIGVVRRQRVNSNNGNGGGGGGSSRVVEVVTGSQW